MISQRKRRYAVSGLLGMGLALGCSNQAETMQPDMSMTEQTVCPGKPIERVTGPIEASRTLTSDKNWLLVGQVLVTKGATLTVQAGTKVCGDASDPTRLSYLNIDQDARLVAVGTKDAPIVFTSSKRPGERAASDWGGVVLRGRAHINIAPGDQTACGTLEGNAGAFGPCGTLREDDSSGELRFVRIEFAGREIEKDKELNGLTLGAVGSGTVIDYVQVHRGSDDGLEMFGGTVNLKHIVVTQGLDDALDWDLGWTGKAQFIVSQQITRDGNNGMECDNNPNDPRLTPISSPTLYNVTLLGSGPGSTPQVQPRFGMTWKNGTAGTLRNLIVSGFVGKVVTKDGKEVAAMGVNASGNDVAANAMSGALSLRNSIFFGNEINTSNVTIGAWTVKDWILMNDNREVDPMLADPFNTTAPDLRLKAGSPGLTGAAAMPADPFYEQVTHVGAFNDTDNWIAGWTAFPID